MTITNGGRIMKLFNGLAIGAAVAALVGAGAAAAADVEIDHAVARVTIIPEARNDVAVTIVRTNPNYPIHVDRQGGGVRVSGDLHWSGGNCHGSGDHVRVSVWGRPDAHWSDMPQVVVRTPRAVSVRAGGAVFGVVGPGQSLELGNAGCGDWKVADQAGALTIKVAGSGDVRGGASASAEVHVSGSGDVALTSARNGLSADVVGSGDVVVGRVGGPLHARIAGSGDVKVHDGDASDVTASIAGSGDLRYGGAARSLDAHIAGSGDVTVARVNGPVTKHIAGSGEVHVGG